MKVVPYLFAASLLAASIGAQAGITITIQEDGGNVVVSGSGFLDIDSDNPFDTGLDTNDTLDPSNYTIIAGSNTVSLTHVAVQPHYSTPPEDFNIQPNFGSGPEIQQPTSNTGSPFAIHFPDPIMLVLAVPENYVSGEALSFSMTFANQTLDSLGIAIESTRWSWGEDGDGEFVDMEVIRPAPVAPTSVPTLDVFGLLGLAGAIGAAGVAMTRRRKQ